MFGPDGCTTVYCDWAQPEGMECDVWPRVIVPEVTTGPDTKVWSTMFGPDETVPE
jgi:hypothetical protein